MGEVLEEVDGMERLVCRNELARCMLLTMYGKAELRPADEAAAHDRLGVVVRLAQAGLADAVSIVLRFQVAPPERKPCLHPPPRDPCA